MELDQLYERYLDQYANIPVVDNLDDNIMSGLHQKNRAVLFCPDARIPVYLVISFFKRIIMKSIESGDSIESIDEQIESWAILTDGDIQAARFDLKNQKNVQILYGFPSVDRLVLLHSFVNKQAVGNLVLETLRSIVQKRLVTNQHFWFCVDSPIQDVELKKLLNHIPTYTISSLEGHPEFLQFEEEGEVEIEDAKEEGVMTESVLQTHYCGDGKKPMLSRVIGRGPSKQKPYILDGYAHRVFDGDTVRFRLAKNDVYVAFNFAEGKFFVSYRGGQIMRTKKFEEALAWIE